MAKKKKKRTGSPSDKPQADSTAPKPQEPNEKSADLDSTERSADAKPAWWQRILREPVAIGVSLLVFARPWFDGLTRPALNTYFLWGIIILAGLWAVRMLYKRQAIHHVWHLGLFAAFMVFATLTLSTTIQFDTTYRGLLYWYGNFFLFVVVSNALRTRFAIGMVLVVFSVSALANGAWSLLHLRYMLPFVRDQVTQNPALFQEYFNMSGLTSEIAHRFEINRAFGTFLFPNALAAFLIAGIPYFVGQSAASISALRLRLESKQEPDEPPQSARTLHALIAGALLALTAFSFVYFLYPLVQQLQYVNFLWSERVVLSIVLLLVLPILAGGVPAWITWRRGWAFCWSAIQAVMAPVAVLILTTALYKTYSRGGILALILAAAFVLLVLYGPAKRFIPVRRAVATVLALAFSAWAIGAHAIDSTPSDNASVVAQLPPDNAAPPAPPAQTPNTPTEPPPTLDREGRDLRMQDLTNTNTFRLRLGYWRAGWRMAMDNLFTGVGLGAFGVAYPMYRGVFDGEVRAAHNDFVQMFAETGVFGFLAYTAFWTLFFWKGLQTILAQTDRREKWILSGLYCGVLAFVIHSLVDFNFYNPGLAFFAFLFAGLFLARAWIDAPETPAKAFHRVAAVPLLIVIAVVGGAGMRIFFVDYLVGGNKLLNVGDTRLMNSRLRSASYYLVNLTRPEVARNPQWHSITHITDFVGDRAQLMSFGRIGVPQPNGGPPVNLLPDNAPIPSNALFMIVKPKLARDAVAEGCRPHVQRLESIDSIFPYGTIIPQTVYAWYQMLMNAADDPAKKTEYALKGLEWARQAAKRSPKEYGLHMLYAEALFQYANQAQGAQQIELYLEAVDEYERAAELYPALPTGWRDYRNAAKGLGEAFVKAGDTARGERLLARAKEANAMRRKVWDTFKAGPKASNGYINLNR